MPFLQKKTLILHNQTCENEKDKFGMRILCIQLKDK